MSVNVANRAEKWKRGERYILPAPERVPECLLLRLRWTVRGSCIEQSSWLSLGQWKRAGAFNGREEGIFCRVNVSLTDLDAGVSGKLREKERTHPSFGPAGERRMPKRVEGKRCNLAGR